MAGKNVALLCMPAGFLAAWCVFTETQKTSVPKGKDAVVPVAVTVRTTPVENLLKTVTEKDDGKKIKLKRGAKLTVRLKAQLGTGYSWAVASNDEKLLKLDGDPKTEDGDSTPGSVEHQVFQFKAISKGNVSLKLEYKRPFDKEAEPSKTFKIDVEITD